VNALDFLPGRNVLLRASDSGLDAWDWRTDSWFTVDEAKHEDLVVLSENAAFSLTEHGPVLYDLNPRHWAERTCAVVRRNLTVDEWRTHFGDAFRYECQCPEYLPGEGTSEEDCREASTIRQIWETARRYLRVWSNTLRTA
jgi:hypothetical protein